MKWNVKAQGDTRRQRAGKLHATFRPIRELVRQLRAGEVAIEFEAMGVAA